MVAAKVRGARQRADKHGQMPRELADLVLAPDSTFTLHITSHSLSLLVQARQVSLVTSTAGTAATFCDTHAGHTAGRPNDTRLTTRCHLAPPRWLRDSGRPDGAKVPVKGAFMFRKPLRPRPLSTSSSRPRSAPRSWLGREVTL